ncbi:anillin-like isoform X2 [Ptychodera flava]|uniref:anillin-like isoform X2 n=1 Tax=Ptychodera flava TaxID=63121 RepID=UPI00396A6321
MRNLSNQRAGWDDCDCPSDSHAMLQDEYVPSPRRTEDKTIEPKTEITPPQPKTRKSRFAALAANINNWEDDTNHPMHKPEPEKKPARIWKPPVPTTENKQPTATPRSNPVQNVNSPVKPSRANTSTAKSMTTNPGRERQAPEASSAAKYQSPVKNSWQPVKAPASPNAKSTQQQQLQAAVRPTANRQEANRVTQPMQTRRNPATVVKEPTPVKRVINKTEPNHEAQQPVPSKRTRQPSQEQSIQQKTVANSVSAARPGAAAHQSSRVKTFAEQISKQSQELSPQSVSAKAKSIQQQLLKQQRGGWQTNEINAKVQKERNAELEMLRNRWKVNPELPKPTDEEEEEEEEEEEVPSPPKKQKTPIEEIIKEDVPPSRTVPYYHQQPKSSNNAAPAKPTSDRTEVPNLKRKAPQPPATTNSGGGNNVIQNTAVPPQNEVQHQKKQEVYRQNTERKEPVMPKKTEQREEPRREEQKRVVEDIKYVDDDDDDDDEEKRNQDDDDDDDGEDEDNELDIMGELDDLLDEALAKEEEEEKKQKEAEEKRRQEEQQKRKQQSVKFAEEPRAPPRPRKNSVNNGGKVHKSNSADDINSAVQGESNAPMMYSVECYRSQRKISHRPPAKQVIKREAQKTNIERQESRIMTHMSVKEKIQTLMEDISQQQSIIHQTSQALNLIEANGNALKGTIEEVEAERLLLIATQRRLACLAEVQRLKQEHQSGRGRQYSGGRPSRGSVTIRDIRLPFKTEYIFSMGSKQDQQIHHFLVLVRNGAHIIATHLLSTLDGISGDCLPFTNMIKMNELGSDFYLDVEVYSMQTKRQAVKDKKGNLLRNITRGKAREVAKHLVYQVLAVPVLSEVAISKWLVPPELYSPTATTISSPFQRCPSFVPWKATST